jgi:quinolinate synthase
LKFASTSQNKQFIVATEAGILHQMQKENPDKQFIPAPPEDSTCACNECFYMKMNTLEKLYLCLKNEKPEIFVEEEIRRKAVKPIERMLEISARYGL